MTNTMSIFAVEIGAEDDFKSWSKARLEHTLMYTDGLEMELREKMIDKLNQLEEK